MTVNVEQTANRQEHPLNLVAAQYVLGTLSASARLGFQRRMQQQPELLHLVYAWERRLNPLSQLIEPKVVPPQIWQKIEAQLDLNAAAQGKVEPIGVAQSVVPQAASVKPLTTSSSITAKAANNSFWKPMAWLSSALAAGLAVFMLAQPHWLQPDTAPSVIVQQPTSRDIAVLMSSAQNTPAWVVRQQGGQLLLSAMSMPSLSAEQDLELWSIQGQAAPQSLGVIRVNHGQALIPNVLAHQLTSGATLAISIEPKNGSPTGQPTGAVLYAGKIV